ncbi:MAG: hypothetical protein AB7K09_22210 [Planctomycetota bacterium]
MKIRLSLPMILLAVAVLTVGLTASDAFAQCCGGGCPNGGNAKAGGGCPTGKCPKARAAEAQQRAEEARQAAETAANNISWKSASEGTGPVASTTGDATATEGSADESGKIVEIEDAKAAANKLIVVFVYTASEDARHARLIEACKAFEQNVVRALEVSQQLADGCECIRVDIDTASREVRKEYSLSRAPEVLIFDATGKRLARYSGADSTALAKLIEAAKSRNEKVIAQLQKDAEKEG